MYLLNKYRKRIEVKLDPGFYILEANSGVGKTYLSQLLREYYSYGNPVCSYTYTDYKCRIPVENFLTKPLKLFIFDRLDMYSSLLSPTAINLIQGMLGEAVILADLKGSGEVKWEVKGTAVLRNKAIDLIEVGRY